MEVYEKEIVENIKGKIINESEKTPFLETKLGQFLSTDWIDVFIDKMALRMYEKEHKDNVDESEIIDKPTYTLTSIFPNEEIQNEVLMFLEKSWNEDIERHHKRIFSEYLDINEDEIILLDWDRIDELILKKYKSSFRGKVRYFIIQNKKIS